MDRDIGRVAANNEAVDRVQRMIVSMKRMAARGIGDEGIIAALEEVVELALSAIEGETKREAVLREALGEACLALEPIARRVFNDNGDHTINTEPFDADVYSACYFASRTVHAALSTKGSSDAAL